MKRAIISTLLAFALCFGLCIPAFAAQTPKEQDPVLQLTQFEVVSEKTITNSVINLRFAQEAIGPEGYEGFLYFFSFVNMDNPDAPMAEAYWQPSWLGGSGGSGLYEATAEMNMLFEQGRYTLHQVTILDSLNTYDIVYTYRDGMLHCELAGYAPAECGNMTFEVYDPSLIPDDTAPALTGFALPAQATSYKPMDIALGILEEDSGVTTIRIRLEGEIYGSVEMISYNWERKGVVYSGEHTITFQNGWGGAQGEYELYEIELWDAAGNWQLYTYADGVLRAEDGSEVVPQNAVVRLSEEVETDAPRLLGLGAEASITAYGTLALELDLDVFSEEEDYGVMLFDVVLEGTNAYGEAVKAYGGLLEYGLFSGKHTVVLNMYGGEPGEYTVTRFVVEDMGGRRGDYRYNPETGEMESPQGSFTPGNIRVEITE